LKGDLGCQYLNISATSAAIKWNFWKKVVTRISMSAKSVEVWIRKNCFQDLLSDIVARQAIPAQPQRARLERVDFDKRDCL
jgi:hypothetical protein